MIEPAQLLVFPRDLETARKIIEATSMIDLSPEHFSEPICGVDVAALTAWLSACDRSWVVQPDTQRKPQRLHTPPMALVQPIIDVVLSHFPTGCTAAEIVLSRMMPGQSHPMHVDQQAATWLTRVHVPLLVNHHATLAFEDKTVTYDVTTISEPGSLTCSDRFHLPVGCAHTFNAQRRHSFSNLGSTPRVHLLFDVLRNPRI